jgi:heterodisulfide reductase subunit C
MTKNVADSRDIEMIKFKKGELAQEVETLSGENPFRCYQCGTCSAGCPFVEDMDLLPDEVIRYVVLDKNEVLSSNTIWICASCYACAERCPRDLDVTKIMEALRQIILRKNIDRTDVTEISTKKRETIPQLAFVCLFRKNIG